MGNTDNTREALNALIYALRETRAAADVTLVELSDDGRTAYIYFDDGRCQRVNVECDSALAAIIDVCNALM